MSEQLVKEELYLQIMDGLEKSCRLMAAYDEMPHEYGDSILYQVGGENFRRPVKSGGSCGAGVEKVEIIVKLKYEERAAVVNLWQLFLSFLYERPYKKNKFCINFYTKFGRLS